MPLPGDEQRMMLLGLNGLQTGTFNAKDARRRIADKMIKENRYAL